MRAVGNIRSRIGAALLLAAVAVMLGCRPAAADRLVTREGAVIETLGPWEVRDRLVIFRLPDGTLSSMRLQDADLEASRELALASERRAQGQSEAAAARAALLDTVAGWADAWSGQRVDEYLSFYDERFQPPSGMTRPRWRAQRRARLSGPAYIELELGEIEIVSLGPGRVRASFAQSYRSDLYRDEVLKSLELGWRGGGWRILREEAGPLPEERAPFVLTDKDVAHVTPKGEEEAAEDSEGVVVAAEGQGKVRVQRWSERPDASGDGRVITGSLRNGGSETATDLVVRALFYDQYGALIAAHDIPLDQRVLGPGRELQFVLPLRGPLDYERVTFQVTGRGFRSQGQSLQPAAAESGEP